MESARCLLIQSGLPPSSWAEVASTANYIRNRSPTSSLGGRTPHEVWNGKIPDVSHFRKFGSKVVILDSKPGKGKLESRNKKAIFLGDAEESKGYKVWIPEEGKVEISRDVCFGNTPEIPTKMHYEDFIPKDRDPLGNDVDPHDHIDVVLQPNENLRNEILIVEEREENNGNEGGGDENFEYGNEEIEIVDDRVEEGEVGAEVQRRGPGRPRKIMTGQRGRPRLQYQPPHNEPRVPEPEEVLMAEIPVKEAVSGPDAGSWFHAMADEVKSILKNDTWQLVERSGNRQVIGSRMVLRNKYKPDGSLERRKARIVARGFDQRPGIHFNQTFAPVARLSSIRSLVALAAEHEMEIKQLEVTTAYLNGTIEGEIYMDTPQFLKEALKIIAQTKSTRNEIGIKARRMLRELETGNKVCFLKKSLYGLKQAGRSWHERLDEMLGRPRATQIPACTM